MVAAKVRRIWSLRRPPAWVWVAVGVVLLLLICYLWVAALMNPDNYRVPMGPTPDAPDLGQALTVLWSMLSF